MWRHIVLIGLLIAALSIGAQAWAVAADSPNWQSVVFTMLTFCQLAHVLAIRSERRRGERPLFQHALSVALSATLASKSMGDQDFGSCACSELHAGDGVREGLDHAPCEFRCRRRG